VSVVRPSYVEWASVGWISLLNCKILIGEGVLAAFMIAFVREAGLTVRGGMMKLMSDAVAEIKVRRGGLSPRHKHTPALMAGTQTTVGGLREHANPV
jgi:hypothetical protein